MAPNVKIDLENVYSTVYKDVGQRSSAFDTILTNGRKTRLGIKISFNSHPLMPNVYNMAFGPVNAEGTIDDKARMKHLDLSKVFSTVLFEALSFLRRNPDKFLGIDGSNNTRAYLYYRCIQRNFSYLSTFFNIQGMNYYIRMLRETEDGNCDLDTEDIIALGKKIVANEKIRSNKLYNYFIFNLNN